MRGSASARRSSVHAALVCLALFIVPACSEQPWTPPNPFEPTPPTPPTTRQWTDLGEYTVTMTAAPSCSLPDYAVTRTYDARLKVSDQDLVVTFDDPKFVACAGPSGFAGTRDGDTVRFTINGDYWVSGYSFVYEVSPGTELGYAGTATGTIADSRIVATLNGIVLIRGYDTTNPYLNDVVATCDATDHRVALVRK
jgi:hypothetical protein